VVAGEFRQRRAERDGERLGATVGIELTSLVAGGYDDPVGQRGETVKVKVVLGDRGNVALDEQLDVGVANLRPASGAGEGASAGASYPASNAR
jgi:hypothetical protein